jgi:hypothetical protein
MKVPKIHTNVSNIWQCKIGETIKPLPPGADGPMRDAIRDAYIKLTGEEPEFIFSGWSAHLEPEEQALVMEDRELLKEKLKKELLKKELNGKISI